MDKKESALTTSHNREEKNMGGPMIKVAVYLWIAILLAVPALAQAGRDAPIYNPEPIAVGKASLAQVRSAMRTALVKRGWGFKEQTPNKMRAVLNVRRHQATIDIDYGTADGIRIKYKDSVALQYSNDDGVESIHRNYNSWIQNLERDMRMELVQYF